MYLSDSGDWSDRVNGHIYKIRPTAARHDSGIRDPFAFGPAEFEDGEGKRDQGVTVDPFTRVPVKMP